MTFRSPSHGTSRACKSLISTAGSSAAAWRASSAADGRSGAVRWTQFDSETVFQIPGFVNVDLEPSMYTFRTVLTYRFGDLRDRSSGRLHSNKPEGADPFGRPSWAAFSFRRTRQPSWPSTITMSASAFASRIFVAA